MPKIQVNDIEIFYDLKGTGTETVAFLNGVAMSTDSWILQTPFFAKKYQVLLHDFRGQGKSTLEPNVYSFEQHAGDFRVLLDELQIEQIHLVGVSYGAEVGMYFALLYPERVKTLTLGTAVSESKPHLKAMIEAWILAAKTHDGELFFKVMAPLVYSGSFYQSQKEWLDHRASVFAKTATPAWFEAFIGLCTNFLTLDVTERLKDITVPTLVLSGQTDLLKPVEYSELISAQIANSKLQTIPDAGHALFLEKPTEFNTAIANFILGI